MDWSIVIAAALGVLFGGMALIIVLAVYSWYKEKLIPKMNKGLDDLLVKLADSFDGQVICGRRQIIVNNIEDSDKIEVAGDYIRKTASGKKPVKMDDI